MERQEDGKFISKLITLLLLFLVVFFFNIIAFVRPVKNIDEYLQCLFP